MASGGWRATAGVRETVLDNGLTVLVNENHQAQAAAVVVHVHAGYFHEPDRWSGIAHVIEHMLFKGTERRPARERIAADVRALGGDINAGTGYEETAYHIVLPGGHIEPAVEILADMAMNSRIDPGELEREIEVIIQESRQKRDNPGAMLVETLYARMFDHHRIRRWRIGHDEPLRALRRDDLVAFMENTYRPENMVVAVSGDVNADDAFRAVERRWGCMRQGEVHREESPDEPHREEFRIHRMKGPIQQRLVEIGFPSVPLLHDDSAALILLGAVLADGRSSRLYRALKEDRRLASSVWADQNGFERVGLCTIGAEVNADDPLPCEEALIQLAGRLARDGVLPDELQRVKTRIESRRLYAQEEVLGVARTLAWYQSMGSYRIWDEVLDRLRRVTAEDVQRVAAEYLRPAAATVVEYLPEEAAAPERTAETVGVALLREWPVPEQPLTPPPEFNPAAAHERMIAPGFPLLFRRRADLPLVALHVLFPGGRGEETEANAGITNLLLKSSLKGTESWTAVELAERIESLGSSIGLALAPDYCGYSLKILARRLNEGLDILKEVVRRPLLAEDEVLREKESIYADIRRQRDSMFSRALELFCRACFGNHPYGLPGGGLEEAIARIEPDDLRAWHARVIQPRGAVVGAVGDIDPDALAALLERLAPAEPEDRHNFPTPAFLPPGEVVDTIDRHQSAAVMGFPGAPLGHPDRYALDLIAELASGLAGRFFQAVRGENALAYTVSSFHRSRRAAGFFAAYTATAPDREQQARDLILQEMDRLSREPVDPHELADARKAIRGERLIHTQTFSAQAGEMAAHFVTGRPLDEAERYLAAMEAVTREEIMDAAARYLRPERMWLGIVRGRA